MANCWRRAVAAEFRRMAARVEAGIDRDDFSGEMEPFTNPEDTASTQPVAGEEDLDLDAASTQPLGGEEDTASAQKDDSEENTASAQKDDGGEDTASAQKDDTHNDATQKGETDTAETDAVLKDDTHNATQKGETDTAETDAVLAPNEQAAQIYQIITGKPATTKKADHFEV